MSYELYLLPKTFDADRIRAYFAARPHYEIDETQARYENPDTGVYFSFDIVASQDAVAEAEGGVQGQPHIAFSINYNRPHTFGLEAEPEMAAFAAAFDCTVEDPQIDGMGDAGYSRERFLSGWNAGNRFAFRAIAGHVGKPPLTADPALIEEAWAWNYGRAQLQREAGETQFVPKVVWLEQRPGAAPVRCVTWTFGVATIIPETLITHVVLVRQERPSPLQLLTRRGGEQRFEFKLLDVSEGIRLRGVERGEVDGRAALFTPVTGPLEMQALFSGRWPKPEFRLLSPEMVVGSDLLRELQEG